jgi:GntR family transcriptional regulator/MocR family aminotransferase
MAALRRRLPDLPVEGIAAGLHLLARLPPDEDDEAVAIRAEQRGVRVTPLSRYTHTTDSGSGLVIGYGRIHEKAIPMAVRSLATALRQDAANSQG